MEQAIDRKNIRILIIDDELGMRNLLEYELGRQGYSVNSAPNGEEGIQHFKKNKCHLVISDIKMPKKDGIQVLEEVKKNDPETEVIMITGFGTIEVAVDAMRKGAYDFIQKPFNIDELIALVEKAVEKVELKATVGLYETSRIIFSHLKIDELYPALIKQSSKILKADSVSLVLLDKDGEPGIVASSDTGYQNIRNIHLEICKRFLKKAFKDKAQEIKFGFMQEDPMLSQINESNSVKSYILCPLKSRAKMLGYFCATRSAEESAFNDSDRRYLGIFSSQISQAIDNAFTHKVLEEKVIALRNANEKLAEMQRELVQSEKLASLGQLSSGIAHEINNPLTIMTGLCELLILEEKDKSKKEDLISIKTQTERCRNIILNLLEFAEQNKMEKHAVDINEVLKKTITVCEEKNKDIGIKLSVDLADKLGPVLANENQLKHVFLNIVCNSFDAVLSAKEPELTIRSEIKDKKVVVTFADNGPGIPDKNIDKIFDPFFTTKEVGKGTGLGLSIAYGIILEHEGNIKVKSKEGKGSAFIVELPIITK